MNRVEAFDSCLFPFGADTLLARARALRVAHPEVDGPGSTPILIVVDSLQLLAAPGRSLRERVFEVGVAGRHAAEEAGAVVLLVAGITEVSAGHLQAMRDSAQLGLSPASGLLGLVASGQELEHLSDAVLALCPGLSHDVKPKEFGAHTNTYVAVAKLRAGKASWQRLNFNGGWFWPENPKERAVRIEAERVARSQDKPMRAGAVPWTSRWRL